MNYLRIDIPVFVAETLLDEAIDAHADDFDTEGSRWWRQSTIAERFNQHDHTMPITAPAVAWGWAAAQIAIRVDRMTSDLNARAMSEDRIEDEHTRNQLAQAAVMIDSSLHPRLSNTS